MFVVGDTLIADSVATEAFACNLQACHGMCCVQGDSGAPLEEDELDILDKLLPRILPSLRPEARKTIAKEGCWEETDEGFSTTCVNDRECVFVLYRGKTAVCAIQQAFVAGTIDFPKPISCHLFPLRVENQSGQQVLNYEQISICKPALSFGRRHTTGLAEFLEEPLTRKFGAAWHREFEKTVAERRDALSITI